MMRCMSGRVCQTFPNELVLEILRWYATILQAEFLDASSRPPVDQWERLLAISRTWREIAACIPELWTHIDLSWGHKIVEDFLERCKGKPKAFYFNLWSPETCAMTSEIYGPIVARHLRSLEILIIILPVNNPHEADKFHRRYLRYPAPMLKTMQLGYWSGETPIYDGTFPDLFRNFAPQLESLQFYGAYSETLVGPERMGNLKNLHITCVRRGFASSGIEELFRICPRLEDLFIDAVLVHHHDYEVDHPIIVAPHLRRLSISRGKTFDFDGLFRQVSIPAIENFSIDFFLRRSRMGTSFFDGLPIQIQGSQSAAKSLRLNLSPERYIVELYAESQVHDHACLPPISYTAHIPFDGQFGGDITAQGFWNSSPFY
ncbi:hypothetical protein SISSUDRAFT_522653 [Sistotremastrum suecicum HHB10207 ss-3]|uniref:Uncharacterized protein n=1 Tax=Sistotremastrum suecicum HHB10207 ss-3 TaxID=1314776 RepID=A0A165XX29_9AGAM|nr:hypothetical protein SISSUDRAFT_522653 [Sistotremastrum suecicum HHB10207 ss-3]